MFARIRSLLLPTVRNAHGSIPKEGSKVFLSSEKGQNEEDQQERVLEEKTDKIISI